MSKVKIIVTFKKVIQNSQDLGSDDEHMISRVFFTINANGKITQDVYVDIKQPVGSDFESSELEVGKLYGYCGAFNYGAFRDAVEKYYRNLVGSNASALNVVDSNVRMRNNTFQKDESVEFYASDESPAW